MAEMAPGRFRLGVGSGEALNEHILGDRWPATDLRLEMLDEAIDVMRKLWAGDVVSHCGRFYTVEGARVYEKPAERIPLIVSGFGPKAVDLASRIGDGYITVQPDAESVERYRSHGGNGVTLGALKVCWGPQKDEALALAHDRWRTESLPGELAQTLPMPAHFDQAAQLVTERMTAEAVPCGPDPEPYIKKLQAYVDAGFDEIYINQIGDDQAGFLDFFDRQIRPAVHLPDA
jgi:G6PDH family F420-dependent oxidoreductase